MSEHSYTNDEGYTVLKSSFHRKRGLCCKSNCLHCPFGTTVNKLGFTFEDLDPLDISKANLIINGEVSSDDFTSSLLSSAFGSQKLHEITLSSISNYKFIFLKETLCGVVKSNDSQVLDFWLKEHFKDQNIDIGAINSSLFL